MHFKTRRKIIGMSLLHFILYICIHECTHTQIFVLFIFFMGTLLT